jgi:hypothetical protein
MKMGTPVPFEMLAYDHAFPAAEADAAAMSRIGVDQVKVTVRLAVMGRKYWRPESLRWERYGWMVRSHQVVYEIGMMTEEEQKQFEQKEQQEWEKDSSR